MNIGFDLDGVCYPWQEIIHSYCYTHNLTVETNQQKFWSSWAKEHEEIIADLANINTFYDVGFPYDGLTLMLDRLNNKYNIYYITSRPDSTKEITFKYLFAWGFPRYENIIYTKDKPSIIKQLKIEAYVEDRAELAVPMSPYTQVYLVNKPYNLSWKEPKNIIRIDKTTDVERFL